MKNKRRLIIGIIVLLMLFLVSIYKNIIKKNIEIIADNKVQINKNIEITTDTKS